MILRATLLYTGLTDVGYRFFDEDGAWIGARVQPPMTEVDADYMYVSADLTAPSGAWGVKIDSASQQPLAYLSYALDEVGSSGSGSDPLEHEVPGSYAEGTAGEALGRLLIGPAESPVVAISAAPAGQTNAYITTYDSHGAIQTDVRIAFRVVSHAAAGDSLRTSPIWGESDGDGLLEIELAQLTRYEARRGNGEWIRFTTGSASTYELPAILGAP